MIAAGIVAGTGIAFGLLLIAYGLVPRREPLAQALADLLDPPVGPRSTSAASGKGDWRARTSGRVATFLGSLGIDVGTLDADLRVVVAASSSTSSTSSPPRSQGCCSRWRWGC